MTRADEWRRRRASRKILHSLPFLSSESCFMSRQHVRLALSLSLAIVGVTSVVSLTRGAEREPSPVPVALDSTITKAYRWRSLGPDKGGRSLAISGVKGQPKVGYFGATGGGLWKTTDGGTTWAPVTDGQITSASVGAVAVCEANPDIVYIGTGETQLRGNVMQGDGVYKSTDAGK